MTLKHIKELTHEPHITLLNYGIGGSRAYGMHTDESDYDYNGFYLVGPRTQYINPKHSFPSKFSFKTVMHEGTVHEMNKALDLIIDCNPNMLELLWRDESDIIVEHELGSIIKSYRNDLLCTKARHTFSGYAFSQLKRIKGHNKWINNPQPDQQPKMIDYVREIENLCDLPLLNILLNSVWHKSNGVYKAYEAPGYCSFTDGQLNKNVPSKDYDAKLLGIYAIDMAEYKKAKHDHEHYWRWKNNRNEARSVLEESHGYDTKHASHLIRLMKMGCEILNGEGVIVKRPDADLLLQIRDGALTYEELTSEFESLESELNKLYNQPKIRERIDPKTIMSLKSDIWSYLHD